MSSTTEGKTTTLCDGCGKVLSEQDLSGPEPIDYEPPADAPKWARFTVAVGDGNGLHAISDATGVGHRYKWISAQPVTLDLCEECAAKCFKEIRKVVLRRGRTRQA